MASTSKLVVAALLLTGLTEVAVAAEPPEHKTRNAQKVLVVLNSIGVNDPTITGFINDIDSHMEGNYLLLHEERVGNGRLVLHFETGNGFGAKQLELKYTPDDSHFEYTARPNAVMVNYRLTF